MIRVRVLSVVRLLTWLARHAPDTAGARTRTFHLDWAHEATVAAVSKPDNLTVEDCSRPAPTSERLLTARVDPASSGTEDVCIATTDLRKAAFAKHHEESDVVNFVVSTPGEFAADAIHDAFTAIELDCRGD